MSLAAGIVARVEGHRENGPVTRAVAHAQQRAGNRERARQGQRTAEGLDEATTLAHLLEVPEELRQLAVGVLARRTEIWACGQNMSANVDNGSVGRESRESAARWAWRFECIVARTLSGGLCRVCSMPIRIDSGAGHVNCHRRPWCFSSARSRRCSPSHAAARSGDLTQPPSVARVFRSPGALAHAGRAQCELAHLRRPSDKKSTPPWPFDRSTPPETTCQEHASFV